MLPKVTDFLSLLGFNSSPSCNRSAELGTKLRAGMGESNGLGFPYSSSLYLQFVVICQNVERADRWQKVEERYLR